MSASLPLLTVAMKRENDILFVRQRGRQISEFLGFSAGDTTRITTALSEIARNAFEYAGGGSVAFAIESKAPDRQDLVVRVVDDGPGIANVDAVLSPDFKSRTGMGIGLKGSRALMDRFVVTSAIGCGTTVVMAKALPWSSARFGASDAARLAGELSKASVATPLGELQVQNQALLNTLQELTRRQAEIERLGVVAAAARDDAEVARGVAERSLAVRDRFMALTTHELRTPLNAIIGYLALLDSEMGGTLTDQQAEFVARAQHASKHLLGLTNDFLDMAQGDAGRLAVSRQAAAAADVMSEAAALVAPQAAVRDITLRLTETGERIMYLGDVARVRQVLVNMLGNAVSFTPPGGRIEVIASRVTESPFNTALSRGPWCCVRVEDTGPGIPSDKLEHVFQPFVQLSSNGQAAHGGNGLGLTVSRQLALLMGGDLTAASTARGAVFTLWLADGSLDEGSVCVQDHGLAGRT